jgi:hypothetical protein
LEHLRATLVSLVNCKNKKVKKLARYSNLRLEHVRAKLANVSVVISKFKKFEKENHTYWQMVWNTVLNEYR